MPKYDRAKMQSTVAKALDTRQMDTLKRALDDVFRPIRDVLQDAEELKELVNSVQIMNRDLQELDHEDPANKVEIQAIENDIREAQKARGAISGKVTMLSTIEGRVVALLEEVRKAKRTLKE